MKFANLKDGKVTVAKKGVKAVDRTPLLRASVAQGMFRMNGMLSKILNVAHADKVIFLEIPVEDGMYFALCKDVINSEDSAIVANKDKAVGPGHTMSFNFAGVYSKIFEMAREKFGIDTSERYEIKLKVADEGNALDLGNNGEFGDTPAVLLELLSAELKNERAPRATKDGAEAEAELDDEDVDDEEDLEEDNSDEEDV